jgi:Sigma-70, region 4.
MQTLNPRERAVVVQRYFLDMSERDMAEELETPPGTVKWLLHAARERLRSLLSERASK